MKNLILAIFISSLTLHTSADDSPKNCLSLSQFKAIEMTKEKVININEECTNEEISEEFFMIPSLVLNVNVKDISNIGISEVNIEAAINLLKRELGNNITEDLIKLMDYYPTVLPATVYIMSYQVKNQHQVQDRNLVLIESELIKINEVQKHRVIAISKEKINSI